MAIEFKGIENINEFYTNHYFSTSFSEDEADAIKQWKEDKDSELVSPWSRLKKIGQQYGSAHERYLHIHYDIPTLINIRDLAKKYLEALGYGEPKEEKIIIDDETTIPVYREVKKANGAPLLWILLSASEDADTNILERKVFDPEHLDDFESAAVTTDIVTSLKCEDLITKIFFSADEPPRFLIFIGIDQIALIDRNKWNEKRYLQFDLDEIFGRREDRTFQAMAILLDKDSLCPKDGKALLDEFDDASQRKASGVSKDLKYALRESIELLGNEVLYDMRTRQNRDFAREPVDASELTLQCLRYMYRMLFVLFIESRSDLGYAPMKSQVYFSAYSLESLRDIADQVREDIDEVGEGYYLFESLEKLYHLIYFGYPDNEKQQKQLETDQSKFDVFVLPPLKAHIFDPERTSMITDSKIRNHVMLRIIDLMSVTRENGKKGGRGRISYSNLGINQMGSVYEALLSYRGFIAEDDLYEVKQAGSDNDPLKVGYFVSEEDLSQYTEDERVYDIDDNGHKHLRIYKKGTFIYRLAGREREKSASYYTPEVLTKCLVKYSLKELLKDKSADDILNLNICEPAMGSAAFLNETISQLAEAYIDKKQKELGITISYDKRASELQRVKMFIADRNVYGIDLNSTAVELAEVSLWLNTIYEGGFVPWFGTQLVNGNSLIGARKQCYTVSQIQTSSKGMHWYEAAPERVPLSTKRKSRTQIYHFLLGDPGMSDYKDKVIKGLEPENIKKINQWRKEFTKPYTKEDTQSLLHLSKIVDDLWEKQVELRKKINKATSDHLSVFGHEDSTIDSHTTIREKDRIYRELYKTDEMVNAGPYARLRFAMDYWCALWFWPIEQADLLPTRSEFIFQMSMILEGSVAQLPVVKNEIGRRMSLFSKENDTEKTLNDISNLMNSFEGKVNIPWLCSKFPTLKLARDIAKQQKFMHWELEFADIFADKGGFDLIIGNPPWIRLSWIEQDILSDTYPMFAVKKLTANDSLKYRGSALQNNSTRINYFDEYVSIAGEQDFLNNTQNYRDLSGMKVNLYKCFLPQAWTYSNAHGVFSYIHPDGVFDDPKGGLLRKQLYPRLVEHFQFANENKLFSEVHHSTYFSLNIYSNKKSSNFKMISNLYSPSTIEECFYSDKLGEIPGIKDKNGIWNINGHPGRIVTINKEHLMLFAKLFDDSSAWEEARLPIIHAQIVLDVLELISKFPANLQSEKIIEMSTVMWDETKSLKEGITKRVCDFPENTISIIYSGPNIGLANPLFKGARRICEKNSDYDLVDLSNIDDNYTQRMKYSVKCSTDEYIKRSPAHGYYISDYRIVMREMIGLTAERCLLPAIIPPNAGHIITVFGIKLKRNIYLTEGIFSSLISDFYIKTVGRNHVQIPILASLPFIKDSSLSNEISCRAALLNTLNINYAELWKREFSELWTKNTWSKIDSRLDNKRFVNCSRDWNWKIPLRTDYERRQALVEIDVLTGLAIGMNLDQLINIYKIQFPVLQSYEADTWYDTNGRIVFTNNRSLTGVGFTRPEWENPYAVKPIKYGDTKWNGIMKDAPEGYVFARTITDDTMPGGPVERTIEYVAPFDCCDREKDYETAWKFFEEKYNKDDSKEAK